MLKSYGKKGNKGYMFHTFKISQQNKKNPLKTFALIWKYSAYRLA